MKQSLVIALIAALLPLLGSSCSFSTAEDETNQLNTEMAKWKGQSIDALEREWGPSNRVIQNRGGGRIHVYEKSTSHTTTTGMKEAHLFFDGLFYDIDDPDEFEWTQETTDVERELKFFVNSQGQIYHTAQDWRKTVSKEP